MHRIPGAAVGVNATRDHTPSSEREPSDSAPPAAASRSTRGDARSLPLHVHLTRSRALWWQRLKQKVTLSAPAYVTVDLRRSRVVNRSGGGTSFVWYAELPAEPSIPHGKSSLSSIVGPLPLGPSHVVPGEVARHGAWEVAFPSPVDKEAWLRWFDLMGAEVAWTPPAADVASTDEGRGEGAVEPPPRSETALPSPKEGSHAHEERGDSQEAISPDDVATTAMPSVAESEIALDVDGTPLSPLSPPQPRRGAGGGGGDNGVYLNDTSTSSLSTPLLSVEQRWASAEGDAHGLSFEEGTPILPLKESGEEAAARGAEDGGCGEAEGQGLPSPSPSPPRSSPPRAGMGAGPPSPFRPWKGDAVAGRAGAALPNSNDSPSLTPPPPSELPPWRRALSAAFREELFLEKEAVVPEAERRTPEDGPHSGAASSAESSLASLYRSPDRPENGLERAEDATVEVAAIDDASWGSPSEKAAPRRSQTRVPSPTRDSSPSPFSASSQRPSSGVKDVPDDATTPTTAPPPQQATSAALQGFLKDMVELQRSAAAVSHAEPPSP